MIAGGQRTKKGSLLVGQPASQPAQYSGTRQSPEWMLMMMSVAATTTLSSSSKSVKEGVAILMEEQTKGFTAAAAAASFLICTHTWPYFPRLLSVPICRRPREWII
jgi:hypothetical protein